MIRISGIVEESIVDGPGIRFVIFSQGCKHNCKGCHNPDTHSFNGGKLVNRKDIIEQIKENPLLDGATFSGGDPFEQAKKFAELGKEIRKLGLNIITYTGYRYEEIILENNINWNNLLSVTDILIDGKFEENKRNLDIRFRGSSNQRAINTKTFKEVEL